MAIDLQNSTNIATGWGPPPKFDAPAIGGTLSAILENRRVQQALQQKQIADAVKQIQEQRQQDAYASALRDTGLSEGQDLSGVSSADQTRIAQLLQARTPDAQREALLQAQTSLANANTAAINRGEGRGRASNKVWIPELNGYGTPDQAFQVRSRQAGLLGKQADEIAGQQEDYGLKPDVPGGFGYMKKPDGSLDYARTPEEQAKPDLVSPVDILGANKKEYAAGQVPTFTQDVYKERQAQSTLRQQILDQQKGLQDKLLNPPPADSGAGGGGGGPNDSAISQANQIKADFKSGKITADEARAQITALNIPGFQ